MSIDHGDPGFSKDSANESLAGRRRVALQADRLIGQWHNAHWGIRVTIVTGALGLILFLMGKFWSPEGVSLLLFFGLPFLAGSVIALARPQPVIAWMDRTVVAYAERRDKAAARNTVSSRWFFRPLYSGLWLSATWTRGIRDPYLRNGVTLALQGYLSYVALAVAYVAIGVVIAIAMLILVLWIMAKVWGGESPARRGRSAVRENFWGRKFVQHFDDEGKKVAQTHEKEGFFGNRYQETVSEDGEVVRRSEAREGFGGDQYTQHYNADGKQSGRSERREDLWGNEYVQHYDQDGEKVGRSEVRESILGTKYVEHSEES